MSLARTTTPRPKANRLLCSVALCCTMLHCVALCCSMTMTCVAMCRHHTPLLTGNTLRVFLHCVALDYAVLHCIALCCTVMCVAMCRCDVPLLSGNTPRVLRCVALCCTTSYYKSVESMWCVALRCGVFRALHYVTLWKGCDYVVCCSVLQCVAVCCNVFQCVPVCCRRCTVPHYESVVIM